jgi:hypothetical protein
VAGPLAAEPGVAAVGQTAVAHQPDIEGRATGVADDDVVAHLLDGRVGKTGDRRHCRSRFRGVDRRIDQFVDQHDAADAGRDQDVVYVTGRPQVGLQAAQMILHQRLQRGVDRRGRGPAIFAHDRHELVRQGERHVRHNLGEQFAQPQFMLRVGDRPEEADRHRLEVAFLQRLHDRTRLRLVERHRCGALGAHAFLDLERVATRNVGFGIVLGEIVRVGLAAFLEHQRVGEAHRGDERRLGDGARDDGVGRPRRAVDQQVGFGQQVGHGHAEVAGRHFDRFAHADENAVLRCQRLADGLLPGIVHHDDVGEGAAGVDRDPESHLDPVS